MITIEHGPRLARLRPTVAWTAAGAPSERVVVGRVVVGSAPDAALVVADRTVSRIHAELDAREDGLWVRDLGSKNGTFIDAVKVETGRVPDGGRLHLGAASLSVRYGDLQPIELWDAPTFGPLIGRSTVMRELFALLSRVAPSEAPVLVLGETGTGKELVARAVHEASPRAARPFVVVDCAALQESLVEAELFGHARGAFTGAGPAREGALEAAHGGTVFLDEIGELPLAMQPKLLRALESKQVRRIGETSYRDVDVRFVSATHRDLRRMVTAGAFREDLYFRIAVLAVTVPALRDREGDVALLAEHFARSGGGVELPPTLVAELAKRPWLGNVRELRNAVERVRALGPDHGLVADDRSSAALPATEHAEILAPSTLEGPYRDVQRAWTEEFERAYFTQLLERHGRRVQEAAQAAGLDRTYVYRMIRRHRL